MPHEDEDGDEAEAAEERPPAPRRPRGGPLVATLRHRWPEYLIEIFVIVFSISVSFGLDQWKERRREDEVERLYLKTLADNLRADVDALGEIIAGTQGVILRTKDLLAGSRSATPPPAARFNAAFSEMARRPSFFAHDAAATPPLPAPTLYNDPEFVNTLWLRMRDRGELLHDYTGELALARRLRQRIARELR